MGFRQSDEVAPIVNPPWSWLINAALILCGVLIFIGVFGMFAVLMWAIGSAIF